MLDQPVVINADLLIHNEPDNKYKHQRMLLSEVSVSLASSLGGRKNPLLELWLLIQEMVSWQQVCRVLM